MKINVDAFRQLLEYLRQLPQSVKLVTTSSVAVFGGDLPEKVSDSQVWLPQSSYGTQKPFAICYWRITAVAVGLMAEACACPPSSCDRGGPIRRHRVLPAVLSASH